LDLKVGPSDCPSREAWTAAVTERLGRDPFADLAEQVLEVQVERQADDWKVVVVRRGERGEELGRRELNTKAADCAQAFDAAVLALVLTVDPEAALSGDTATRPSPSATDRSPSPAPQPKAVVRSEALPARPATPTDAAKSARQQHDFDEVRVAIAGTRSYGLLPRPGWGLGLALAADFARTGDDVVFAAIIDGFVMPEVRTPEPESSFAFGLAMGSFGACASYAPGWVAAGLCGGAAVGAVHAVVYDEVPSFPGNRWWLAGFGALTLRASVPTTTAWRRPFLELQARAWVPATRYRFTVAGRPGSVFEQEFVSLAAVLSAGCRFF
jgi:hypothetical protein